MIQKDEGHALPSNLLQKERKDPVQKLLEGFCLIFKIKNKIDQKNVSKLEKMWMDPSFSKETKFSDGSGVKSHCGFLKGHGSFREMPLSVGV